jgi:hypothetical protein
MKPRIVLVSFGLGGSTAYLAPQEGYGTCFVQGYETPETWDERAGEYRQASNGRESREIEGAILLDKTNVLRQHSRYAFDSPLVDPKLQPGEEDCLSSNAVPDWMIPALGGMFQFLAVRKKLQPKWKGLDSVSVQDYVKWWFDRGARVGVFKDGRSHWLQDLSQIDQAAEVSQSDNLRPASLDGSGGT